MSAEKRESRRKKSARTGEKKERKKEGKRCSQKEERVDRRRE